MSSFFVAIVLACHPSVGCNLFAEQAQFATKDQCETYISEAVATLPADAYVSWVCTQMAPPKKVGTRI
jgi:hypothetical protein